jgi:signal transduction histidine kinase
VSRAIQLKAHPFRLLLYVEWILLGLAVLGEIPWDSIPYLETLTDQFTDSSKRIPFSSLLTALSVASFGLMGLRLPIRGNTVNKSLYTALEFGLIWLTSTLGGWQAQYISLYLIIVIRSSLIFQKAGRLFVTVLVLLSFCLALLISLPDLAKLQNLAAGIQRIDRAQLESLSRIGSIIGTILFGLVLAFVLLLVNALLTERQSRQNLAIAHEQLQRYSLRIEDQATLQERNRIAHEIHDSLGHALTAQSILLENALLFSQSNTEKTQTFLKEAKLLGATALKNIRQSVATLRSDPLQGQSLEKAIATLIQDFCRITNITPNSKILLSYPITSEVSTAVYRITQEALTNISKHSNATKATLQLETKAGGLYLTVADNGQGFNPEQNTTGFGLHGMRERAITLEGRCKIISHPGEGCRIAVDIPLAKLLP